MNNQEKLNAIREILSTPELTASRANPVTLWADGFVEFDEVNEKINEWHSKGGLKRIVAEQTSELYALLHPNNYIQDQDRFYQIKANQDFYATSMGIISAKDSDIFIGDYHLMLPKYYNTLNGHRKWKAPYILDKDYSQWRVVNKQIVKKIDNVSTITMGNYSNPLHPDFFDKFFNNIPSAIIKKMEDKLNELQQGG